MSANEIKIKDPAAVLDYKFDWNGLANGSGTSNWLAVGETISTKTITAATGITVDSSALSDTSTSVTVWLSGGIHGVDYTVACKITTSANRTDERTMTIQCRDR